MALASELSIGVLINVVGHCTLNSLLIVADAGCETGLCSSKDLICDWSAKCQNLLSLTKFGDSERNGYELKFNL